MGAALTTTNSLAHSPQSLSPGSLAAPQAGQSIPDERDVAHWEQNLRPSRLSVPQLRHCIESLPSPWAECSKGPRTRQPSRIAAESAQQVYSGSSWAREVARCRSRSGSRGTYTPTPTRAERGPDIPTEIRAADSDPETVTAWYRRHGYDFLVLSDHNHRTLLDYGTGKRRFRRPLMIPGEEVSVRIDGGTKAVHLGAVGITRVVEPIDATGVVETLQANVNAIREAGGIAAINHPNFNLGLRP